MQSPADKQTSEGRDVNPTDQTEPNFPTHYGIILKPEKEKMEFQHFPSSPCHIVEYLNQQKAQQVVQATKWLAADTDHVYQPDSGACLFLLSLSQIPILSVPAPMLYL